MIDDNEQQAGAQDRTNADDRQADAVEPKKRDPEADEDLLQEIRERYDYAVEAWSAIREEATTDMRFISGDPWDDEDRKEREEAGRPCINHDELNQYCNQAINQVRQSPPGIRIDPAGNGSSDKTAEFRQDMVRGIEYRSSAQDAYITAYENALQRSYGFFRITRDYVSDTSFDQEIQIRSIINADSVLYDPDVKQPDWSDAMWCFVLDRLALPEFKRQNPNAQKKDFTDDDRRVARSWVDNKTVLTAEYWKVRLKNRTLLLIERSPDEGGPFVKFRDELKSMQGIQVLKNRVVGQRSLTQYKTNGVEILKALPQPGKHIPIIPVVGKELYLDEGSGPERKLVSMVRLARDPQMSMAYLVTLEMEEAGLTPKVPYIGYVGQFETDKDTWDELTKVPRAYAQLDPIVDAATGQVLPKPDRVSFAPNFAAYEVAKDSCRRAVMSAIGITSLPTAAQRDNEKSGVALERIENQQSVGSFHFTSNLHRAMKLAGKIIDEWLPVVYDTEREIGIRRPDDSHQVVKINTQQPVDDGKGGQYHYRLDAQGDHDISISVGPSYETQREAASDFLNTLITNLANLPLSPAQAQKLLALGIQMKQLGPKGDQMADIIAPPQQGPELPPQAQAAIQQAQAMAQQLQAELDKLLREKEGKVVENQYRERIEQMKQATEIELKRIELEMKIGAAEITTKAQDESERRQWLTDLWTQLRDHAHEIGIQSSEQQHERDMHERQAAAAAEQAQIAAQQQPEPAEGAAGAGA
jgi:hypothetical protein